MKIDRNADDIFLAMTTGWYKAPVKEYRFAPPRRWRFDYAWPDDKIAVEVEGAVWTGGRHTRGAGFLKDMEKYNEAASSGWIVIRTTPKMLCHCATWDFIAKAIKLREAA